MKIAPDRLANESPLRFNSPQVIALIFIWQASVVIPGACLIFCAATLAWTALYRFAGGIEGFGVVKLSLPPASHPFSAWAVVMNDRLEDPVLASSRREALWVLAIWLVACTYSLAVCYAYGYGRDAATLTYVLGFPDWVFAGIIVPWSACTAACFVLSYFLMKDEDLGAEQQEESLGTLDMRALDAREADHA